MLIAAFDAGGGAGKPRFGQLTVWYAASEEEAIRIAHEQWPNAGLRGPLGQELPLPAHFEAAAKMVAPEDLAELLTCGPDAERHVQAIREFAEAGSDRVCVHQVGPDQDGFFRFHEREVMPALAGR